MTRRRRNLIGLLLLPVVLHVLLRWFELRTVYQPSRLLEATGDELGKPRQEAWLTTADGVKLHAWYFPGPTNGPVAILCHGNGGNISHRLDLYDVLLVEGIGVLAFDYRGYGNSEGSPGEEGTYRDAVAAYDWLVDSGIATNRIIAFGESLGGGVATELCRRRAVVGLILQSTYTSTTDLGAELFPWLPVRMVGRIKYNTVEKLPEVTLPVLVMHSAADTLIPMHHGRRNFEQANEPKLFHEIRGDHNDPLIVDREAFAEGIRRFLKLVADTKNETSADTVSADVSE